MPAGRVPNIDVSPIDLKTGKWNVVVWRFLASLAAQFSGVDPPLMPVNAAGILSIARAQARDGQITEAAVVEAAQRILGALRPGGRQDSGALDLALIAGRPRPQSSGTQALDLATIALSRAGTRQQAPAPQIIFCTQATFPALAATPGGTLIIVTDYGHSIFWDGTTSVFVDGGNCFIALFDIDPGAGWHLLDGTANVPYLKVDGTLGTYTVEDATIAFHLKASLANSGPNAAVAPTISGVTDDTTIGFVPASAAAGASAGTAIINNPATGTPTQVLTPPFSPGGGGGGGSLITDPHHHGLSAANAPISATAEPRNLARRPWFRQ